MNVFLPYRSFEQSARCLDFKRLNKQIVEAYQILNSISKGPGAKWRNHPATRMFEQHVSALIDYGFICCSVAEERTQKRCKLYKWFQDNLYTFGKVEYPQWLEDDSIFSKIQSGYRSNLLRKGRADAVCATIKSFLKIRSINTWLKNSGFPEKTMLKLPDIVKLEQFCTERSLEIHPNYYKSYGWSEPDSLPYVWPVYSSNKI